MKPEMNSEEGKKQQKAALFRLLMVLLGITLATIVFYFISKK